MRRHLFDVCQAHAPVLAVLGHPCEASVVIREVKIMYLGLALAPMLPQIAALQQPHLPSPFQTVGLLT